MNFAQGKQRKRRRYEVAALVAVRQERVIGLLWTRRGRKSTTLGNIGFDELSVEAGRTVIAASASLLLGSELVSQTITATEQALVVGREAAAMHETFAAGAEGKGLELKLANSETDKLVRGASSDDVVDLYKASKLEMRLYFDKTSYSRLRVIAPNPATARGWGGTVLRDEVGFTQPALEVALRTAVDPIFKTDPSFKMIYASNLPLDSRHPWYRMTLPPPDSQFPANETGHFYRGQDGILIHRVSISDAYAAGHVLYDNRGAAMTLAQFRKDPSVRNQLPSSYDLIHVPQGSACVDLVSIISAQHAGARRCHFVYVSDEAEFNAALEELKELLGDGEVGVGIDLASTNKETSNPTGVTLTEKNGLTRTQRLVLIWKESRPEIHEFRYLAIVKAVNARRCGRKVRRVCIDGTNDRLFAVRICNLLRPLAPAEVVVGSVSVDPLPASYEDAINYKTYLGDLYCAAVNGNAYEMPNAEYLKDDHLLVTKNGPRYECEPTVEGMHGDTFDSGKLAEFALMPRGGELTGTDGIIVGRPRYEPALLAPRF